MHSIKTMPSFGHVRGVCRSDDKGPITKKQLNANPMPSLSNNFYFTDQRQIHLMVTMAIIQANITYLFFTPIQ